MKEMYKVTALWLEVNQYLEKPEQLSYEIW